MVWTNDVSRAMDVDGVPRGGGLPPELPAAPVSGPVVTPELDQQSADGGELQALEAIASRMRELQASMAGITAKVSAFNERSAAQESIIVRMQSRLEELQGDQVRALLRPVFEQLGALHGDITLIAERELEAADQNSRVGKELAFLTNRVETAFEALGLVSVEAKAGVVFDSRLHAAVRSRATEDATLDKRIAEVQRQGFATPGTSKTELPARVVVYSHAAQAETRSSSVAPAPADSSVATDAAAVLGEASTAPSGPTGTPRTERTPQVPLPPMPPSYTEGS